MAEVVDFAGFRRLGSYQGDGFTSGHVPPVVEVPLRIIFLSILQLNLFVPKRIPTMAKDIFEVGRINSKMSNLKQETHFT